MDKSGDFSSPLTKSTLRDIIVNSSRKLSIVNMTTAMNSHFEYYLNLTLSDIFISLHLSFWGSEVATQSSQYIFHSLDIITQHNTHNNQTKHEPFRRESGIEKSSEYTNNHWPFITFISHKWHHEKPLFEAHEMPSPLYKKHKRTTQEREEPKKKKAAEPRWSNRFDGRREENKEKYSSKHAPIQGWLSYEKRDINYWLCRQNLDLLAFGCH